MEFSEHKPIFVQICDSITERILNGKLSPGERISSVREYGAEIGVNPNTVMRSYERLTTEGVIYNKRGIGFFIAEDAIEKILAKERREFLEKELPELCKRAKLLKIDPEDIVRTIYSLK